jgi:hypothetical protein
MFKYIPSRSIGFISTLRDVKDSREKTLSPDEWCHASLEAEGAFRLFICLSLLVLSVLVGFTFCARDLTTLLPTDMRRSALSVFDFPTVAAAYFSFGGHGRHALQLSGSLALWPSSTRQGLSLPVEKTNWMALLFETAFFSDMWRASSSFSSSSVYSIPLILLVLCVLA